MNYWVSIYTKKYVESFEVQETDNFETIFEKAKINPEKAYIRYVSLIENKTGYDNFFSQEFKTTMCLQYLNYYFEGIYTRNNHVILLVN